MPLNNNAAQLQDCCQHFGQEITNLYYEMCESSRTHIRNDERNHAIKMLYSNGALTKLTTIEATPENAKYIHNIFKLMKRFKKLMDASKDASKELPEKLRDEVRDGMLSQASIEKEGANVGFTEEESLCIYNMVRIEAALKNLNAQKGTASDFILERI